LTPRPNGKVFLGKLERGRKEKAKNEGKTGSHPERGNTGTEARERIAKGTRGRSENRCSVTRKKRKDAFDWKKNSLCWKEARSVAKSLRRGASKGGWVGGRRIKGQTGSKKIL